MYFSINPAEFQSAIMSVAPALSSKTISELYKCFYIKAEDDSLTIRATDLAMISEITIMANVREEGEVAVPARILQEALRKLSGDKLDAKVEKGNFRIRCGGTKMNIASLEAKDFPSIDSEELNHCTFERDVFMEMLRGTMKTASPDNPMSVLMGVCINMQPGIVEFVSSDSFRLSLMHTDYSGPEGKAILPAVKAQQIYKALSNSDESSIRFDFSEKHAVIGAGYLTMSVQLLQGNYIDYKKLLAKVSDNPVKLKVNRKELLESIDRVSLFSSVLKNNLVTMSIDADGISLSGASDTGMSEERTTAQISGVDTEAFQIGVNSSFLKQSLSSHDDEEIMLSMSTAVSPILITGENFTDMVLPVRIA